MPHCCKVPRDLGIPNLSRKFLHEKQKPKQTNRKGVGWGERRKTNPRKEINAEN